MKERRTNDCHGMKHTGVLNTAAGPAPGTSVSAVEWTYELCKPPFNQTSESASTHQRVTFLATRMGIQQFIIAFSSSGASTAFENRGREELSGKRGSAIIILVLILQPQLRGAGAILVTAPQPWEERKPSRSLNAVDECYSTIKGKPAEENPSTVCQARRRVHCCSRLCLEAVGAEHL